MMEFTYDGIVRWGFGFYNPNHAAALICAIFPFLWGWKKYPWLGWILSGLLLVPLVMTYSRTGIIVLVLEFCAFFILNRRKNWQWLALTVVILVLAVFASNLAARFVLDGAVTNRPKIWLAGIKLIAANPLGVGHGYSGMIASAFLLPEHIQCRTLVNSHLTLICEYGMLVGLLWLTLIFYALMRGVNYPAVWCAVAGLTLSAFSATVFDWQILFDFHHYGRLTVTNFLLSWFTVGLYISLLGIAVWQRPKKKMFLAAFAGAAAISGTMFCFYDANTPKVCHGTAIKSGYPQLLVLHDATWKLANIRPFVENSGYILPLTGGMPDNQYSPDAIILFGEMCMLADKFESDTPVYFVDPPEFVEFSDNVKGIYLSNRNRARFFDQTEIPILDWP